MVKLNYTSKYGIVLQTMTEMKLFLEITGENDRVQYRVL